MRSQKLVSRERKNRFKRKGIGEWIECLSRKAKKKAKLGKGREKTAKYRKGVRKV